MLTTKPYWIFVCILCTSFFAIYSQETGPAVELQPSAEKVILDITDNFTISCKYSKCANDTSYIARDGNYLVTNIKRVLENDELIMEHTYKNFLPWWENREVGFVCRKFCNHTLKGKKSIRLRVNGKTPLNVTLKSSNEQSVIVNSNATFHLQLDGSPMPSLTCRNISGQLIIICSSQEMKGVMYNNPSTPCTTADRHYQIRSKVVQTRQLVFQIINATLPRDNGTISCNWTSNGETKEFTLKLHVTEKTNFSVTTIVPSYATSPPVMKEYRITESTQKGTMAVVIATVSTTLVVTVLVVTLVFCRRERKFKNKYKKYLESNASVDPSKWLNEQILALSYDKDWEFPPKFLSIMTDDLLGQGTFGKVYRGQAHGIDLLDPRNKTREGKNGRMLLWKNSKKKNNVYWGNESYCTNVAVKTVRGNASFDEIRDFVGELKLMMHIGKHKNIVNLLGVCCKDNKLFGILEFCPNGNLKKFLQGKRDYYQPTWIKTNHNVDPTFTVADQVTLAQHVCEGMKFLISQKCIHRDLAARNVLLAENYVIKVADFGLAKNINQDYYRSQAANKLLPCKWMALESLLRSVYTQKTDVWSFGVLLWEIMSIGGTPYYTWPFDKLVEYLIDGKRMEKPYGCIPELYTIMLDCWKEKPEERPNFEELSERLQNLFIEKTRQIYFEENGSMSNLPIMKDCSSYSIINFKLIKPSNSGC